VSRLRDEQGMTMVELLVAATLSLVLLTSVLTAFTGFNVTAQRNQELGESQQRTRAVIDKAARELRNLASPTPAQPQAIDQASAYDLVFQTVDPAGPNSGTNTANVRRVRYCLDAATTGDGRLWSQVQTWTTATVPAAPSTAACPDAAWGNQRDVARGVTNRQGGLNRPVFSFNTPVATEITTIGVSLWSSAKPAGRQPADGLLATRVFLRNQNQRPAASFSAASPAHLHLFLNGSASADPEGETLTYKWFDGQTQVGTGITFDYLAPAVGTRQITLKVYDSAGLEGVSGTQAVTVR